MNSQTITVNLVPGLSAPAVIRVSQYDVGRPLTIRVFDGTGAASFGASVTATIVGTKPSGLGFTESGTIAGNTVTLNTTLAMTQELGMFPVEIRFAQTGEDIGTANFILAVEPSPHPEGTTDGTTETARTILEQATEAAQSAQASAETAEAAAEAVTDKYSAPYTVTSASQMTDETKVYLYEGNESGYTAGNWYYYNGSAWVSGGQYGEGVEIDTTLSVSGRAADAKVVGDEISNLKEDLVSEQDDGLFHRYLTWEHGGIDNATGENNNEGSLTRSRMPEYLLYSDYNQIFNGASARIYVIYYDSEYNFVASAPIDQNQTYTFNSNSSRIYFRLDFRGALNLTNNIKVYQTVSAIKKLDEITSDVHETKFAQVYLKDNDGIIEEDADSKKLYFCVGNTIYVRYGINGSAKLTGINRTASQLANELNASLVTSPNGVANCIEIPDEYGIAFNMETATFELLHRYRFTNKHILVMAQNGGYLVDANPYLFYVKSKEKSKKSIPSYWESAISESETSINNALSSDETSASFAFVTDTHIGSNCGNSGMLLEKVMDDCHIPVWFHGGDAVTGTPINSKANLINDMNADFEQFAEIESIGLRAIGNHDPAFGVSASHDSNLNNGEINHYYHGVDREKYLQVYGDGRGYFYKDIAKDKLRCIVLDIIPYDSQVDSNDLVTGSNKMWYHQFGSEQLEWFANVLQNTPEGYSVVVCSHIAPVSLAELQSLDSNWSESVPKDYLQARKIAEAYALKSTYTFNGTISGDTTGDSYNINVDFTSAHGDFVCFICGHTHKDFMLTLDNINIVGTANDSKSVSTNASSFVPTKTIGTNTEQIIDFFCVLPKTRTVRIVRLGAYLASNGKIRQFTY